MDISDLRNEHYGGSLTLADLNPDPFEQFETWFNDAMSAQESDANAMSLATANAAGQPSVRTVLLKYMDKSGFVFYTNLESRKAKDIAENAKVSLLFFWTKPGRQVVISGTAETVSRKESVKYFLSRPRGSQLGACVSRQSRIISSRALLEQKLA